MSISSLSLGAKSMEASPWRKEAQTVPSKIFASAGDAVKADNISLTGRAKAILSGSAVPLPQDPPICYGPQHPKLTTAKGVFMGKVDAKAIDVDQDPPICYGPKIDKHVKIDSKATAIDEKNVQKIDLPGKDDDVVTPPRTRQEAWADGWRNLGAATRRLMELVEMAKNPGLSTTERAKLNTEFKAIVDQVDSYANALVEEQGLTGGTAQIWRNSVGSKELFIDGNDNLLTAEGAQTLSDKLAERSEVVFRTMQYLGVA